MKALWLPYNHAGGGLFLIDSPVGDIRYLCDEPPRSRTHCKCCDQSLPNWWKAKPGRLRWKSWPDFTSCDNKCRNKSNKTIRLYPRLLYRRIKTKHIIPFVKRWRDKLSLTKGKILVMIHDEDYSIYHGDWNVPETAYDPDSDHDIAVIYHSNFPSHKDDYSGKWFKQSGFPKRI